MIRTNSVELTTIPSAVAYRRKASAGGSVVVIVRPDASQPGIASISKTSGEAIPADNTPTGLYSAEAFAEAIELTWGMPYLRQGRPSIPAPVPEEEKTDATIEVIVDGDEYQRLVDAYTDKRGRLSYDLLDKDLIQLAHRSEVVGRMIANGAGEDDIVAYVVGAKFRNACENPDLTDEQVAAMAALIDEVSPRGAFKGLRAKVRQMLGEAKRA